MNEHRKNGVFEVCVHVKKVLNNIRKNPPVAGLQQEDFFAYAGYLPLKRCKNSRNITDI